MIERQIDSPNPKPLGLVVWKALKRCSTAAGASPGPESRTATSTSPDSVVLAPIRSSRGPSLDSLMASKALRIKLRITCCSSTRSPRTAGRPSTSSVCTRTRLFVASLRVSLITSRIAALMSTRSSLGGAFLMRLRIPPTTAPARPPSLTMRPSAFRTSSRFGGSAPTQRNAAWALLVMGDRRRELPHRRNTVRVRQLHPHVLQRSLGLIGANGVAHVGGNAAVSQEAPIRVEYGLPADGHVHGRSIREPRFVNEAAKRLTCVESRAMGAPLLGLFIKVGGKLPTCRAERSAISSVLRTDGESMIWPTLPEPVRG